MTINLLGNKCDGWMHEMDDSTGEKGKVAYLTHADIVEIEYVSR